MVRMEAIKIHSHTDPDTGLSYVHVPGEVYDLPGGGGMTADQAAESLIAMGAATRAAAGAVVTSDPELAPIGELPKNFKRKPAAAKV
jgi:hypothetical protein